MTVDQIGGNAPAGVVRNETITELAEGACRFVTYQSYGPTGHRTRELAERWNADWREIEGTDR